MTTLPPISPTPLPQVYTALPLGTPVNGTLTLAGEVDWFAVELAKGQLYSFELVARDGTPLGSGGLSLLRSDGYYDMPVRNSPYDPVPLPSAYRSGVVNADGTYYLQVDSGLAGTDYTVRATRLADDHAATQAGSGVLVLEAPPVAANIDAPNDRDWFGVALEAGRGYFFAASQPGTAAGVTLSMAFPSSGSGVAVSGGYAYTPATSGMHYLEVMGAAAGAYNVSVTRPADDSGNIAGLDNAVLTRGTELAGKFEYAGDNDVVRTQVQGGEVYRVAYAASTDPYFGMQLQGSDAAGVQVLSQTISNGARSAELIFKATGSGDAYINVGGIASGTYALAIQKMYTDDRGNTAADAAALALGATFGGHIDGVGDADSFEITVEAGKTYEVIGRSDIGTGFTVSNMDPAVVGFPGASRFSFTAYDSGKQVVYVSAANKTGAYTITLAAVTNDTLDGALNGGLIDPGAGFDTVRFGGALSDYTLARTSAGIGISLAGGGSATLANVERVLFAGADALALDVDGIGGTAYRLYRAAFDRAPDKAGVGFWMNALEDGISLHDIAQGFINSPEFTALYGANVSNTDFVTRLYANILDRTPDAGGFAFWLNALNSGYARADVLANFSESSENIDAVAALIGTGFAYIPYGG